MNSDIKISGRVKFLVAVIGPGGNYHETRCLDGRWLDVITITQENFAFIEEQLRAGHAELFDDKSKESDANTDILPDGSESRAGNTRRNLRTKRS